MALGLWLRWGLPLASLLPYDARAPWVAYEPVLWSLFAALLVVHLLLVRVERARLATRVGLVAVGVGLASLATGVAAYLPPATPGVLIGLALLATAAGTLVLGSVWSGWMLGHWYLVTPQLSPRPLLLINAGLAAALGVQALLVLGMAGAALVAAPAETGAGGALGALSLVVRAAGGYRRGVSAGVELDDLADGADALDDGGDGAALYCDGRRGERRDHRSRAVFHRAGAGMRLAPLWSPPLRRGDMDSGLRGNDGGAELRPRLGGR